MKPTLSDVNLNITSACAAVEHYFNTVLFKQEIRVDSVTWVPKEQQFKVSLKDLDKE